MADITRIAMWSGPRNISTAMMRSWENRPDTAVVDEPFYACYLTATGIRHPMQEEILASQSSDWSQVIAQELLAEPAPGITVQYQKHMTHHMVADIDEHWFAGLKHAFLIRHPAEVVASYRNKRETVTADDVGFEQQHRIYQLALKHCSHDLPVIDAKDVLSDPAACLARLCDRLDVAFHAEMLSWPEGRRDSDGVWAAHWYNNVEKSTGFAPWHQRKIDLGPDEAKVVEQCLPFYQELYERRITVD